MIVAAIAIKIKEGFVQDVMRVEITRRRQWRVPCNGLCRMYNAQGPTGI